MLLQVPKTVKSPSKKTTSKETAITQKEAITKLGAQIQPSHTYQS
jgi:hypothetical protein